MSRSIKHTEHVSLINAIKSVIENKFVDTTVEYDELESTADIFITKGSENTTIKVYIGDNTLDESDIIDIIDEYQETVYNQETHIDYEFKDTGIETYYVFYIKE
jgi:hypothetical protein